MEIISLKNKEILVNISKKGAEIQSIQLLSQNTPVLWQKDENYWNRIAPILFPIVGKLKNNQYHFDGNTYTMKQHGFARDCIFELLKNSEDTAEFQLCSTEETLSQYPFQFSLNVNYRLNHNSLEIQWVVTNMDQSNMPFSIGGHPGFHLQKPLENYKLVFNKPISASRFLIENGHYTGETEPILTNSDTLFLNDQLFVSDAIVLKHAEFESVSLKTITDELVATCKSSDFPYWGFWTKSGAPFFCIEPWAGLADAENYTGSFEEKEGMVLLQANQEKQFNWSIEF